MKREERMEAYIGLALDDLVESLPSELKGEKELCADGVELHQFSEEFEKKMKKLCVQSHRKEWYRHHKRMLRNVAACIVALLCVGGVTIASVDAIRIPIMNFFLNLGDSSSEFSPIQSEALPVSDSFRMYYPTYIPDGYVVIDSFENKDRYSVTYQKDEQNTFVLSFRFENNTKVFDSEDSAVEEIEIKNSPAIVSTRENQTIVVWQGNGFTYTISGVIDKEECIKILSSCNA